LIQLNLNWWHWIDTVKIVVTPNSSHDEQVKSFSKIEYIFDFVPMSYVFGAKFLEGY